MLFVDAPEYTWPTSVPEYVAFPRITPEQIIDTTTEIIQM